MSDATLARLEYVMNQRDEDAGATADAGADVGSGGAPVVGTGGVVSLSDITIDRTLDMNGRALVNVAEPTDPKHVATKAYADMRGSTAAALALPYDSASTSVDVATLLSEVSALMGDLTDAKTSVFQAIDATVTDMAAALQQANTEYTQAVAALQAAAATIEAPTAEMLTSIDNADTLLSQLSLLKGALETKADDVQSVLVSGGVSGMRQLLDTKVADAFAHERPYEVTAEQAGNLATLESMRDGVYHFHRLSLICDEIIARATASTPSPAFAKAALRSHLSNIAALEAAVDFNTPVTTYDRMLELGGNGAMVLSKTELVMFELACQEVAARFASIQEAVLLFFPTVPANLLVYDAAAILDSGLVDPTSGLVGKPATPEALFHANSQQYTADNMAVWVENIRAVDAGLSGLVL